jgi:hypothetical protein
MVHCDEVELCKNDQESGKSYFFWSSTKKILAVLLKVSWGLLIIIKQYGWMVVSLV